MKKESAPVLCPVCHARLFDTTPSNTKVYISRRGGILRMKCHKCKQQVGIDLKQ